jgi:hypothetical protein
MIGVLNRLSRLLQLEEPATAVAGMESKNPEQTEETDI